MSITGKFSENLNHVATLDKSLATSLTLSKSNITFNAGSLYDASAALYIYNRGTGITETISIPGTLITSANLSTYLALIKTTVGIAYPSATVTHSVTSTASGVLTFNALTLGIAISGSSYYLRGMNITISLSGTVEDSIDAILVSPIEILPAIATTFTQNVADSSVVVSENIADIASIANDLSLGTNSNIIQAAQLKALSVTAHADVVPTVTYDSIGNSFDFGIVTGPQGVQGIQGIKGDTGSTGPQGAQGIQGLQGYSVLTGTSAPTTQGVNNDVYLNTITSDLYKKIAGAWVLQSNIKGLTGLQGIQGIQGNTGVQGIQGIQGIQGTAGYSLLSGTSSPTTQGIDNDLYINTATSDIYKKISGTWVFQSNIKGLTGATGATGSQGPQGIQGITGPQGIQGDTGLTGPQGIHGATGAQGVAGYMMLSGIVTPTTDGVDNDMYINTATSDVYKKVAGSWTFQSNIKGLTGNTGPQGIQGIQGQIGSTGATGSVGNGIASVIRTTGTGAPGTTDIYTITYTDTTTSTFSVYNGADGITPTVDAIPTDASTNAVSSNAVFDALAGKQETLVSGTNIKSINGITLLGAGNITISGGGGTNYGLLNTQINQLGGSF